MAEAVKPKRTQLQLVIRALARATRDRPPPADLWAMLMAMVNPKANDPTVALTLGSAIEQALEIAISTHFVLSRDECAQMFDDEEISPIPTFAVKIRLAYALGIYQKHIRDELNLIKGIRNAFAHAKSETAFSDKHIADACNLLYLPQRWHKFGPPKRMKSHRDLNAPREKFITSVHFLFMYLEDSDDDPKPKLFSKSRRYAPLMLPGPAERTSSSPN